MEKQIELKPCPFCGQTPRLVGGGWGYKIVCCFGETYYSIDKEELFNLWNRRKGEKNDRKR